MATTIEIEATGQPGAAYQAPFCTTRGGARSTLFSPSEYSLWKLEGELDAGAEIEWGADHGDEAVYVLSGDLDVEGRRCSTGGAVVVEAGVPAVVRATADTRVLHFGPVETQSPTEGLLGPAEPGGHTVHVVNADEAAQDRTGGMLTYFADGTCPTCRITFFMVDFPVRTSPSHFHSEDEIIHVLDGELRMGRDCVTPGNAVAIAGGRRYGFRAPEPLKFLNYRRDVSTVVVQPGSEPRLETRAAMAARLAPQSGESGE